MIYFLVCGFLGWLLLIWRLDRPTAPAWYVRDTYRFLNICLVFLLLACLVKMTAYRAELRAIITYCR